MDVNKLLSDFKIISALKKKGKKIILCHGVFDLVHIGHLNYFKNAKLLGDILIISVTDDKFVDKGPGRPSFSISQRLQFLEQLNCVDYILTSKSKTASNIIKKVKPDVYCKGKDYKNKINSDKNLREEHNALKSVGGKIKFIDTKLYSSSKLINQNNLNNFSDKIKDYISNINKKIDIKKIDSIFNKISNNKILHIGELIIDKYVFTETVGMSGKEATTIVKPVRNINFVGGSGYIANTLANFVKKVFLLTFLGNNRSEKKFLENNIKKNVSKLFLNKGKPTITKKRYIDNYSHRRMIGVYNVDQAQISNREEFNFLKNLKKIEKNFKTIIVSDFGHEEFSKKIIEFLSTIKNKIYLNCQMNAFSRDTYSIFKYKQVNTLIVNESELRNELRDKYSKIETLIKKTTKQFKFKYIIVTRGKNGGIGFEKKKNKFFYYPAFNTNPVDTIGAGDTFFSVTSLFLSNGVDPEVSSFFGNLSAYISTSTMGNENTVKFEELKKLTYHMLK